MMFELLVEHAERTRSRTLTQVSVSSSRLHSCNWYSPQVFGSSLKVTIGVVVTQ